MIKKILLICGLFMILAIHPAHAIESGWSKSDHSQARLISAVNAVGDRKFFSAGLELNLDEDWYTYWRMPGDSGMAPQIDWSKSSNIKEVTLLWPVPKRYDTFGLQSFGYDNQIIFPLHIEVEEAGKPATLMADINALICNQICVPQDFSVSFDIPEGEAIASSYQYPLEQALKLVPQEGKSSKLKMETVILGKNTVVVNAWAKGGFKPNVDMLIETADHSLTLPPKILIDEENSDYAVLTIAAPDGVDNLPQKLFEQKVTITLINGEDAIEKDFKF